MDAISCGDINCNIMNANRVSIGLHSKSLLNIVEYIGLEVCNNERYGIREKTFCI